MSYARTPDLPREHPLAKLLDRSIRAHKLPSCEGCKHWDTDATEGPKNVLKVCGEPVALFGTYDGLFTAPSHFCAAWEPKA